MIAYKATCSANGKGYVGITRRELAERWASHCYEARRGSKVPLHCAIRKYGAESFELQVVGRAESWAELCQIEIALIAEHGTRGKGGYNVTMGGDGGATLTGRPASPEHRRKISEALTGKKKSPEHIAKIAAKKRGSRHSEEARAKISAALVGRKMTEEHRRKIGEAQKDRITSEETRKLIGAKSLGRGPLLKAAHRFANRQKLAEVLLARLEALKSEISGSEVALDAA